jgi:hypothetical protein
MERRIRKVRFKDGRVEIKQIEEESAGDTENCKEIIFKCAEAPSKDFVDAMKRLVPHVRKILELPEDWCDGRIEITGVSFSKTKEGIDGAVITGYVKLETAASPLQFNTPHLSFQPTSEKTNQPLMPDEAQADLEVLRGEVQAYWDGKREQADLFDGKAAAAGEGRPEPAPVDQVTSLVDAIIDEGVKAGDIEPTDDPKVFKMKSRRRDGGAETTTEIRR